MNGKQQLLLNDDGHGANGAAQRQRAYVSHEDLRRMSVIPEKPDARAHHGPAEDSHLRYLRHLLQLQIFRKDDVPAQISKDGQRACGNHRAADGQPVEAVREVHSIAGPHQHQHYEQYKGK